MRTVGPIIRASCSWFALLMAVCFGLQFSWMPIAYGQLKSPKQPADKTEILPRWKFVTGDELGVAIQGVDKVIDDQGNAFKNERNYNLRWTVESVDADGNARMAARFDRIQVHHEKPRLEYDSLQDSPWLGASRERDDNAFLYQFRAMAHCVFRFEVNPRGGVSGIRDAEAVLFPMLYTPGDMFALPKRAVKVGDTWSVATAMSSGNFLTKGRARYRLVSLERNNGQMSCRIDGKCDSLERHGFAPSQELQPTIAQGKFDVTAGRVVSEKISTQAKVEVEPGKVFSLVSETVRWTYSLEKQAEPVPHYSLTVERGVPRPIVLGGVRVKEFEKPIETLLIVILFHEWSDNNKNREPDIDELTGIDSRFEASESPNFIAYALGLPDALIQYELVDTNGVSLGKNNLPLHGPNSFMMRTINGLDPGVYFVEFSVDGRYVIRVPFQILTKVEVPKLPRASDAVWAER